VQRLQVNRRGLVCSGLAEDARGALLQLALPLRDLVGMNVELPSANVLSPLTAARATFALNAAV
jgi:hypothetical protein